MNNNKLKKQIAEKINRLKSTATAKKEGEEVLIRRSLGPHPSDLIRT